MEREDFESLILKVTEKAEAMRADMNKNKALEYKKHKNRKLPWSELEATFKAMLYHQFLKHRVNYSNISLENSPDAKDNKKIKSYKVDMCIKDHEFTYLLEVKMINVRKTSGNLQRVYNKGGLCKELVKLNEILDYFGDTKAMGIAIAIYNGHDDKMDCKNIKDKLNDEINEKLNRHVKLIVCANGKCEYVKN
jgi:hypothetical protein